MKLKFMESLANVYLAEFEKEGPVSLCSSYEVVLSEGSSHCRTIWVIVVEKTLRFKTGESVALG
ncbi:MAG: hypothetical protein NTZ78_02775 [Candidatus Aureabacteria bacterium]|nr:hypothetical protein [Candidatus Auribacterota bacterium]